MKITDNVLTHHINNITPRLQQSIALVYCPLPAVRRISGARYVGVPQNVFIIDPASTNFDNPKSVTCRIQKIYCKNTCIL